MGQLQGRLVLAQHKNVPACKFSLTDCAGRKCSIFLVDRMIHTL
jgi:hypothetical protein